MKKVSETKVFICWHIEGEYAMKWKQKKIDVQKEKAEVGENLERKWDFYRAKVWF